MKQIRLICMVLITAVALCGCDNGYFTQKAFVDGLFANITEDSGTLPELTQSEGGENCYRVDEQITLTLKSHKTTDELQSVSLTMTAEKITAGKNTQLYRDAERAQFEYYSLNIVNQTSIGISIIDLNALFQTLQMGSFGAYEPGIDVTTTYQSVVYRYTVSESQVQLLVDLTEQ